MAESLTDLVSWTILPHILGNGAETMALVTVNTKYQVTLPSSVRKQARLAVGDLFEARVQGKKITLTPEERHRP